MSTSTGKFAIGFCDRTGFQYLLKDLVPQIVNGRPNGLLVGRDMLDQDHPQWKIGRVDASDPQSLDNPRPDKDLIQSRSMPSWNPVGYVGLGMTAYVGRATT